MESPHDRHHRHTTGRHQPLQRLHEEGQAVWLDFVDRGFLQDGGLRRLIAQDGATGVTSNPSIFEKAMGHGDAYDAGFKAFYAKGGGSVLDAYESQAIADIKAPPPSAPGL
jgi:transaldolase/glucose-6-phosphate isomerase